MIAESDVYKADSKRALFSMQASAREARAVQIDFDPL